MAKLNKIYGINEAYSEQLKSAGVTTVEKLLLHGESREGRKAISIKARIDEKLVSRWVHHADFFRIKGIAGLKTVLLEAAGIGTVKALAGQDPDRLYEKLVKINDSRQLIERVPGLVQVRRWVKTAQRLRPAVR